MVWGQAGSSSVDDLVGRLSTNDPKLTSLHILKFRRLAEEVSVHRLAFLLHAIDGSIQLV